MLDLFYQGGPLFMGILTLLFIVMIGLSLVNGFHAYMVKSQDPEQLSQKIRYTRSIGLLALIIGLLGQLLGLFSAFQAIELGNVQVSPAMLAGGFKVSMITTLYGIIIYATSILIWFGLSAVMEKK